MRSQGGSKRVYTLDEYALKASIFIGNVIG